MRLNKFCLPILLIFCFFVVSCNNSNKINIVEKMSNGLENEIIKKIYADDIQDVYEMTYAKYMEIWYYETDLNDNGHDDIIVIVRSPLHSGSHGDSLDIWINDGNGEYNNVFEVVTRILADNPEYNGQIFISDKTTNGFKNIEIICENNIILTYKDGIYKID